MMGPTCASSIEPAFAIRNNHDRSPELAVVQIEGRPGREHRVGELVGPRQGPEVPPGATRINPEVVARAQEDVLHPSGQADRQRQRPKAGASARARRTIVVSPRRIDRLSRTTRH